MQISDVEVYDVTLTGIWTVPDVWYHVWYRIIIRFGNGGNWAAFVYVRLKVQAGSGGPATWYITKRQYV